MSPILLMEKCSVVERDKLGCQQRLVISKIDYNSLLLKCLQTYK